MPKGDITGINQMLVGSHIHECRLNASVYVCSGRAHVSFRGSESTWLLLDDQLVSVPAPYLALNRSAYVS
jgi:uncharacterized RmlC-like cupin family protein